MPPTKSFFLVYRRVAFFSFTRFSNLTSNLHKIKAIELSITKKFQIPPNKVMLPWRWTEMIFLLREKWFHRTIWSIVQSADELKQSINIFICFLDVIFHDRRLISDHDLKAGTSDRIKSIRQNCFYFILVRASKHWKYNPRWSDEILIYFTATHRVIDR